MAPDRVSRPPGARGQANLVALVAALVALTTAMVVGVAVADGALSGAARDADQRRVATSVADRLVAADSPLTNRTNVLAGPAVEETTAAELESRYPALSAVAFRVTLGEDVLASSGTVTDGTTMRRIVLVERSRTLTVEPRFTGGNAVTLPRRTGRVVLDVSSPDNRTVSTVRADGRTVLHDPDEGLDGTYTVGLSRRETVRMTFLANGSLQRGDVTMTLTPRDTNKSVLAVTVDD